MRPTTERRRERSGSQATLRSEDLLRNWRADLLRLTLLTTGGVHLLVGVAICAITRKVSLPVAGLPILISALLFVGSRVRGAHAARSIAFLGLLLVELVVLELQVGWTPGVTLLALAAVMLGGLLLGRKGGWTMVGATVPVLGIGLWAAHRGWPFPQVFMDYRSPAHWLRAAILFGAPSVGIVHALRWTLKRLDDARRDALAALIAANRESFGATRTRVLRATKERKVRDAQRLHAVSLLATGTARLVDEALVAVRRAIDELPRARDRARVAELGKRLERPLATCSAALRRLLVFSQHDPPAPELITLPKLVEDMRVTLCDGLPANVSLVTELAPCPQVSASPVRVRQLILNLVLNARDALSEGGRITVRTFAAKAPSGHGARAALTVEDDGSGMTEEVLARASDPYFTTRDPNVHPGLGLFVASGLLQQWGGELRLDSTLGQGTRATVSFPTVTTTQSNETTLTAISKLGEAEKSPAPVLLMPAAPKAGISFTDTWKAEDIRKLTLLTAIGLTIAAIANTFLVSKPDNIHIVLTVVSSALLFAGWRVKGLSPTARMWLSCSAALALTSWDLLTSGYMQPATVAAHALPILVFAVYSTSRLTTAIWAVATSVFVFAMFGPLGREAWDTSRASARDPVNWERWILLFPLVCAVFSSMVLSVVDALRSQVEDLEAALAALLAAKASHREAVLSLELVEGMEQNLAPHEAAGRAAGTLAHDLNNAFTSIMGWGSILATDLSVSPQDCEEARRTFVEAKDLIESLVLQLGTMGSSDGSSSVPTDLADAIRRVEPMVRRRIGSEISLELSLVPGCEVQVADDDLRRLVLNLAINAGDAMESGGRLLIRCDRDEVREEAILEVEDEGTGMDEATKARIFEPFFTTKADGKGTGLGLHQVAQVVRSARGRIAVESSLGSRTKFRLALPSPKPPPT